MEMQIVILSKDFELQVVEAVYSVEVDDQNRIKEGYDQFINYNGLAFRRQDLEAKYKTFKYRPLFLDHYQDINKAQGFILDVAPNIKTVNGYEVFSPQLLIAVDKQGELYKQQQSGRIYDFSMGAFSSLTCSICGRVTTKSPCPHHTAGQSYNGRIACELTTEDLNFVELSGVYDPAFSASVKSYTLQTDKEAIVSPVEMDYVVSVHGANYNGLLAYKDLGLVQILE